MNSLNTKAGVLLLTFAATFMGSASASAPYDLVQPKMREMINVANQAMNTGNIDKAIAYTDLILVQSEVKYSINTDGIADYQRENSRAAAHKAIEAWTEALNGEVKFTEVESNQANVRIKFEQDVRSIGNEVAGYAVWQRQVYDWGNGHYSPKLSGDISLRSKTPTGRDMPEGAIIHSACHELGHLLGLWDSPNFGDVMGPLHLKNPITKPSITEVTALRDARLIAQQISQTCMAQKQSNGYKN
ncbi:MAG: matrixin family metalloprotease [Fimbriimonadaceae bacterium]